VGLTRRRSAHERAAQDVRRHAHKENPVVSFKKLIVAAVFGLAGLAAFAGTCTITNLSLVNTDGAHKTFGGQLNNNSGVNILQHNYLVAFIDGNNNLVETTTVEGCLRSVQDGKADFFSATSTQPASNTMVGLARMVFDSSFKVGTVAAGDVTITVTSVTRTGTSLAVSGTIRNNATNTLVEPDVCVVVRDASDNVLIVRKETGISDIAHNATQSFSVTITVPDDTTTAHTADVWVDGLDGSSSGAPIAPESDLNNSVVVGTPTPTGTPVTPSPTGTPVTPTVTNTAIPPTATATP
jgi:hypothetical protein